VNPIRLLDLRPVSALRSQTVYHAVAHAMTPETPDTIILVSPSDPYVCIGFHQELEKEVDLEYCSNRSLPVYRREVGGGAVYLDDGQVFAQWIFQPLVKTYLAFGIEAYLRPVNDVHVGGKKIGGTGAAQIGNAEVVVGSLMFAFDKRTMAKVLKVSSEKMRDKIVEGLEQYMTTMEELLGTSPDRENVKQTYIAKCEEALGVRIIPGQWTDAEEAMAAELDRRFASDEWLCQRGGLHRAGVKIHEDIHVVDGAWKAPGGLIRVTARLSDGCIEDITLSGDFTMLPSFALGGLETALRGVCAEESSIVGRVQEAYRTMKIESPGVTPDDFARALAAAIR
jgi:lipoate-protein ligase A